MSASAGKSASGGPAAGGGGAYRMVKSNRPTKETKDEGESSATNLRAGTRVIAKWRDAGERRAVVIERRLVNKDAAAAAADAAAAGGAGGAVVPGAGGGTADAPARLPTTAYRYYVHWSDFNRRMDSWITADCLRYDEVEDTAFKREEQAKKCVAPARQRAGASALVCDPDPPPPHHTLQEGAGAEVDVCARRDGR
jgi:hypothetical protein